MVDPEISETLYWQKVNHVGAPAIFALEMACQQVGDAFESWGIFLVGSALTNPERRDIDLRMIMDDAEFAREFPQAETHWEHDPKWLLLTVSISGWLTKLSGLPVDFQFQPQTHANKYHKGPRHSLGMRFVKVRPELKIKG